MSNMETLEAISADYIKRSDALEEIHGLVDTMSVCVSMDECNGMRSMKERALTAIGKIEPADVQPVVRCRDCDHWNERDHAGHESLGNFRCSCAYWSVEDGVTFYTAPTDFCCNGEKRMDGDE